MLDRACCKAPACNCTCRGFFCSNAGWGERAEPRPVPSQRQGKLLRRWAGGGGERGEGRGAVKIEAGLFIYVTDLSVRLPAHRWKRPGDRAGQCSGKRRKARAARTPLPPPPDFPGTACSLPLLLYRCRIISVRGDLTAGDFAEKSHLSTHPRPCPQGVSLSTKNNPPIVSPVCITSPGSLSPPHLPLPRLLDSFALKMKAPSRAR